MGFRHLNEARLTKKHLKWIGIFYLIWTILGAGFALNEESVDGTYTGIGNAETTFQSFLYWELIGIFFIALWVFVRYLNRLLYGGDIDL